VIGRLEEDSEIRVYLHESIDSFRSMLVKFWDDINLINDSITKIDPNTNLTKLLIAIRDKLSSNFEEPDYFKKES
jgi:hypothetical protein